VNGDDVSICDGTRDELSELALGILTGEERARVLAHLEGCERCANELAELAVVADRLMVEGPTAEPSAGFELRVLERIQGEPRRLSLMSRRGTRIGMALAAAAVALVAAFVSGRSIATTGPSRTVTNAIAPATEPNLHVAELTSAGHVRGDVYAFGTSGSWMLMTVQGMPAGSEVICEVTTASGKTVQLGSFWITSSGSGSWASGLPVRADQLRSAQVVTPAGTVLAKATFSA
jgi:hypothetical protein